MAKQALPLIICLSFCYTSALQLYVQSDGQKQQCENVTNCATISEYATEGSFESNNVQLTFFSGKHSLNKSLYFVNLRNIILDENDPDARDVEILCQENVGLLFENVVNLSLSGLTFTGCSRAHTVRFQPFYNHSKAGVFFGNITNLSLSGVVVQDSVGYGAFLSGIYGSSNITDCVFQNNFGSDTTSDGGNAVLAYYHCEDDTYANVTIERSQFIGGRSHTMAAGLLILVSQCTNVHVDITESIFHANHAESQNGCTDTSGDFSRGGNLAFFAAHQYLKTNSHRVNAPSIRVFKTNITQGKACFAGGIFVSLNELLSQVSIIKTDLRNNSAWVGGGAVYVRLNSQHRYRPAISNGTVRIERCSFHGNRLLTSSNAGVALMLVSQIFGTGQHLSPSLFLADSDFRDNHADVETMENAGAVLYVSHTERLTLTACTFEDNGVTAVLAVHSVLVFRGDILVDNNVGHKGGGIVFREASRMILSPNSTLTISNNHADYTGGGIYVEDQCAQLQDPCFYQLDLGEDGSNVDELLEGIKVRLINNTAYYGGDQIYGGRMKTCTTQSAGRNIFKEIFELVNNEDNDNLSVISSEPESVHFCHDGIISSRSSLDRKVYSGEEFNISLALTGQCGGTTPGKAEFGLPGSNNKGLYYAPTTLARGCSNYSITVYTNESSVQLDISPGLVHDFSTFKEYTGHVCLNIEVLPPPLGIVSTGSESSPYECIPELNLDDDRYEFKCKLNKKTNKFYIKSAPPVWLGFVTCNFSNESVSKFVKYQFCPSDYCKHSHVHIRTSTETFKQDDQCANSRSGILCGQCKQGFSLSIGSSACLDCSDITIAKTIAISLGLLLLGLLLVLVLLIFNLTITQGTMNEFLLYANMVHLYWGFLQPASESRFDYHQTVLVLKGFFFYIISSINLIFGCDCCFYKSFDVIGRTWVQFFLVAYLWVIAGIIIWASRRFAWVGKFIEHNAIHVLATIFVLSHTSTSLAILHAVSFAVLDYPGSNNTTTWYTVLLYDGNVPYLSGQHIPLLITSTVFTILSVLFTLMLLCVQPLQRFSHLKPFRWVNKLKPLLDAYTCPHIIKPRCRFWNGYLLLTRTIVYIVFTTGVGHDYHRILDVLSVICLILMGTALMFGGVYTKTHLNVLSALHIVNLGVLSVAVRGMYLGRDGYSISTSRMHTVVGVSLLSMGLATSIFFATVCYHVYKQVRKFKIPRLLKSVCLRRKERRRHVHSYQSLDSCVEEPKEERLFVTASITSCDLDIHSPNPPLSSCNYREPQLKDYDSI